MTGRKPNPNRSSADADHAAKERERYQALHPSEKRRIVVERDRGAQQEADARRHERDKPKRNEKSRNYEQSDRASGEHDQERKARAKVQMAKGNGTLQAPSKCPKCGRSVPLHAHHDSHAKPMAVRFLCARCHGEESQVGPK